MEASVSRFNEWLHLDKRVMGLDLHGVIDTDIPTFKLIMRIALTDPFFKSYVNKLYIVSGPSKRQIVKELHKLGFRKGVHYTDVLSVVDYLKAMGVHMWLDHKKTWWADDEAWWTTKAELCDLHKIDILWDDKERYVMGFPNKRKTIFCYYNKSLKERVLKFYEDLFYDWHIEKYRAKDGYLTLKSCPFCGGETKEHPDSKWRKEYLAVYHKPGCFLLDGNKHYEFNLVPMNELNEWNKRMLNGGMV